MVTEDTQLDILEEPSQEEIEAEVSKLLSNSNSDFSELDAYIEENEDNYPEDLADFVFREAIRQGNSDYVSEHVDDFDLNDAGGYSSYLYETEDSDMIDLLMSNGAFKSWDDYEDCLFAMETVKGSILAFNPDFQKKAFKAYKAAFNLKDSLIKRVLSEDISDDDEELLDSLDRDVEEDLRSLGVTLEDGKLSFADMCDEDGYDTMELLDELGWSCAFEGDSWKLETLGVYFIK